MKHSLNPLKHGLQTLTKNRVLVGAVLHSRVFQGSTMQGR